MESLISKYRPQKLTDIVGQEGIIQQLEEYLESPYPCALLFEGPTGTGKTSTAMILAKELGVEIAAEEFGGLWQIASGEQTGEGVRRAVDNLRVSPWKGSGWKVLIVNEADIMTESAKAIWLDALENVPPKTVIIFTSNDAPRLPRRLLDRCERFHFHGGGLFARLAAQELVNKVWRAETGRDDAPDLDALGETADENGDVSFRRVLQMLTPWVRIKELPVVAPTASEPAKKPGVDPKKSAAAKKAWETMRTKKIGRCKEVA